MLRYVVTRLTLSVPLLLGAALMIFLAGHFAPGDPIQVLLGDHYNPVLAAQLRHQLGLDRPLPVQFFWYVAKAVTGNFGSSYVNPGLRVSALVGQALPVSLSLAVMAVVFATLVGVPLGVTGAASSTRALDRATQAIAVLGLSIPQFVLAAIFVLLFGLWWRLLPVAGWGQPADYVLPVLILAAPPLAYITRITRSSVAQTMVEDYVRTARSKGLRPRTVLLRHVLRNAALPVVTIIGLAFGNAIVGAFVVEVVFNIPGIARIAVNAILQRDYTVIQAVMLLYTVLFTAVNLLVDVSYAYLNPRIHY